MKRLILTGLLLVNTLALGANRDRYTPPSDETFGATWNGQTARAPTLNAVYDAAVGGFAGAITWGSGLAFSAGTVSFAPTELEALTFGTGATASWAYTFDVAGATNPTMTVSATGMAFSHNVSGATYGSDGSISDAELLTWDDGALTQILVGGGAGSAGVWTEATGTDAPVRAGNPTFTAGITLTTFMQLGVSAGVTATNPGVQGDNAITKGITEVSVCGVANDAVTAPAAVAGREFMVINNGAATLEIWPASGDNLGGGVDTAVTLAAGLSVVYRAYDGTNWEQAGAAADNTVYGAAWNGSLSANNQDRIYDYLHAMDTDDDSDIDIGGGGTGAKTAAGARTNLGIVEDDNIIFVSDTETITVALLSTSQAGAITIPAGAVIKSITYRVTQACAGAPGAVNWNMFLTTKDAADHDTIVDNAAVALNTNGCIWLASGSGGGDGTYTGPFRVTEANTLTVETTDGAEPPVLTAPTGTALVVTYIIVYETYTIPDAV